MFWRRKRPLSDFAEEIESHIAHEADQLRDTGNEPDSIDAAARRAFGNPASCREAFYESGRWLLWDCLVRDVRHALRLAGRRPDFSIVVVLTLALGIGATTAIFSVIDAVLLRPLPYRDSGRLAMLWQEDSAHGLAEGHVSLLNFRDWKDQNRSFGALTAFCPQTFLLGTGDGPPERMRAARVSADFFPLLGVTPLRGRVFSLDEEHRGDRLVLLSYGLWLSRFGASDRALASDLVMDGRKYRIIGVMPPSFRFPFPDTQVWQPMTSHPYWRADRNGSRSSATWYVLGRIRPGTTWKTAQTEMNAIARRVSASHPEASIPPEIRVVPLPDQTSGKVRLSLAVLFGAVFMMLLIACINVANLLLARGSAREREFSVRKALGAGRRRLAAQLLAESLTLALAGGLLGLSFAAIAVKALVAFGPRDIPRLGDAHLDPPVLIFALLLSLFAAAVSGLWPVLAPEARGVVSLRSRQWSTLADRGIRNTLVIGEFAIALVLLACAGLMGRSYLKLESVDPGFRTGNLLIMRVDLHVGRTADQQVAYFRDAIERVRALPGVRSAGAVTDFLHSDPEDSVVVEGRAPQQPGPCEDSVVGPFFETAGIPLRKGRFFSDQDRRGSPLVAVINEAMARRYWPGEDAIGQHFRFPGERTDSWITVVGVTGDMHRQSLEKTVAPQVFRPLEQNTDDMVDIIVRTSVTPDAIASTVQHAVQSIDPAVAKFNVTTVERQMGDDTAQRRFQTSLIGLFSVLSLLLSAIGIYGLMHFLVVRRANEIGVRMALGARYGTVLALVLRQGLKLAGVGLIIGTLAALGLTRLVSSLLFDVTPTDPVTFAASAAILIVAAALATWIPARRAARIDPVTALRQE